MRVRNRDEITKTYSDVPALLPPGWTAPPFMALAKFTLITRPCSSFKSMLSMASWASADEPYVTKAKPRCLASKEEMNHCPLSRNRFTGPVCWFGFVAAEGSWTSIISPGRLTVSEVDEYEWSQKNTKSCKSLIKNTLVHVVTDAPYEDGLFRLSAVFHYLNRRKAIWSWYFTLLQAILSVHSTCTTVFYTVVHSLFPQPRNSGWVGDWIISGSSTCQ